jgi:hypothetical protein
VTIQALWDSIVRELLLEVREGTQGSAMTHIADTTHWLVMLLGSVTTQNSDNVSRRSPNANLVESEGKDQHSLSQGA